MEDLQEYLKRNFIKYKLIAVTGKFALGYKTFLGPHQYTTHDIEITTFEADPSGTSGRYYRLTVGEFTKDRELTVFPDRFFDYIDNYDDLKDFRHLVEIAQHILELEPIEIDLPEPEIVEIKDD